ncbi:MAG: hypothetical protein V4598_13715 [Bdellovibrionota bacterium]
MKNMIIISVIVMIMTIVNTHAEVYECASENQGKYLVALQDDSGILFRHENGYFQDIKAKVQVARAMDGGPVSVRATGNEENDWGSGGCFVMNTVTYLTINHSSRGDTGSTIQFFPDFVMNPDQTGCEHRSLPRPLVLPPQPMKCKLK